MTMMSNSNSDQSGEQKPLNIGGYALNYNNLAPLGVPGKALQEVVLMSAALCPDYEQSYAQSKCIQ
jgi:hypothetical protein